MGILNQARAKLSPQFLADGGAVNPAFDRVSYAYQPFSTQSYTATPQHYQGFSQPVSSQYGNNATAPLYSAPISISRIPELMPQAAPTAISAPSLPQAASGPQSIMAAPTAGAGPITSPANTLVAPPSAPSAPAPAINTPSIGGGAAVNQNDLWANRLGNPNEPWKAAGYKSETAYKNRLENKPWQSFGAHSFTRTGFDKDGNVKTEYRKKEDAEYQPTAHDIHKNNVQSAVERSGLLNRVDDMTTSQIRTELAKLGVNSVDTNRMINNIVQERIAKREEAEKAKRNSGRGSRITHKRGDTTTPTSSGTAPAGVGLGDLGSGIPQSDTQTALQREASNVGFGSPTGGWTPPSFDFGQWKAPVAPTYDYDAAGPFNKGGMIGGYQAGGNINYGNTASHPGAPRGTDQVPIWAEEGEFVMTREATDKYLPVLEKMNGDKPPVGTVESAMSQLDDLINKYAGGA